MSNTAKIQYKVFADNLRIKYNIWKKKTPGGSQDTLAELISAKTGGKSIDRKSISNWLNAKQYPSKRYMTALCEILRTTEAELLATTFRNQLMFDRELNEQLHTIDKKHFDTIGLDESFLMFIHAVIDGNRFPVYTPIQRVWGKNGAEFTRGEPTEVLQIDSSPFQVFQNGKTIGLNYADYQFLKTVQDKVENYINYLFWCRSEEMKDNLETVKAEYATGTNNVVDLIKINMEADPYFKYYATHTKKTAGTKKK